MYVNKVVTVVLTFVVLILLMVGVVLAADAVSNQSSYDAVIQLRGHATWRISCPSGELTWQNVGVGGPMLEVSCQDPYPAYLPSVRN